LRLPSAAPLCASIREADGKAFFSQVFGGFLAQRRKKPRKARSNGGDLATEAERVDGGAADPKPSVTPNGHAPEAASAEAPPKTLKYTVRGATDVGRKRENNEDSFLIDESLSVFAVADGMGGHAGGGIASRLAVETLQASLRAQRGSNAAAFDAKAGLEDSTLPDVLRVAVESACAAIYRRAQSTPSLNGMGTTLTTLMFNGPNAYIAHVGDSRVYLIRRGRILQVSDDHSLVNEQLKAGVITAEEAKNSRFRNVITRSVGFEEDVLVDLLGLQLEQDDIFLICCDGLSNMVDDAEIAQMAHSETIEDLPLRLIGLANDHGGDDNITVVAVKIREVPPARPSAPAA
jgi:serine/threonine protein phosphatase PrpC